jgi:hypothetical protein
MCGGIKIMQECVLPEKDMEGSNGDELGVVGLKLHG